MAVLHGNPSTMTGIPVLESLSGVIPHWVTDRGGDVRAFDITENREVYGPGHAFLVPNDIVLTNGVIRVAVGSRGALPTLAVSVYKGAAWRSMGYLFLSGVNNLVGARIVSIKPELATVIISIANEGYVFVDLHRFERMIHILHGSTRAPQVICPRSVFWYGAPTLAGSTNTSFGAGTFGSGTFGGPPDTGPGAINSSPLTAGIIYETTIDDGSTRVTDANGLTRAMTVLRSIASKSRFGVSATTQQYTVGAFVATSAPGDDLADYQRQLVYVNHQETTLI